MGLSLKWSDTARRLSVSLSPGSRMRAPLIRDIEVRVAGQKTTQSVKFSGRPVTVTVTVTARSVTMFP
jgi:hypothetical protein